MRFLPALNIALAESTWVYIHVCMYQWETGEERESERQREKEECKEVGQRQMRVLDAVIYSRGTNSFPRRALLFQSDSTGNLELLSVESHAVQVDQQLVPVLTAGTLDTGRGISQEGNSQLCD